MQLYRLRPHDTLKQWSNCLSRGGGSLDLDRNAKVTKTSNLIISNREWQTAYRHVGHGYRGTWIGSHGSPILWRLSIRRLTFELGPLSKLCNESTEHWSNPSLFECHVEVSQRVATVQWFRCWTFIQRTCMGSSLASISICIGVGAGGRGIGPPLLGLGDNPPLYAVI